MKEKQSFLIFIFTMTILLISIVFGVAQLIHGLNRVEATQDCYPYHSTGSIRLDRKLIHMIAKKDRSPSIKST